jgi:hypothetical protein
VPFPRRSPSAAALLLCALLSWLAIAAGASSSASAAAPPAAARGSATATLATALLVFLPAETDVSPDAPAPPTVLDRFAAHPQLALGMSSATQSGYSARQALLDLTAGTRTSLGTYRPSDPPLLTFTPAAAAPAGAAGRITLWPAAVRRAATAPAEIFPGLLAGSIPGGAGYAGVAGQENLEAIAAAGRDGSVAAVSLGAPTTVAARAQTLLRDHRLVVASLTPGATGDRELGELIAARRPDELLIATQAPPPIQGPQLLWMGIAGLGRPGGLTSATTHVPGVVAGIDVLPTVLDHLGIAVPKAVRGEPITASGSRDVAGIEALSNRLGVIGARRTPAIEAFFFTWLGVVLLAGVLRDRRGIAYGMRLGGLALTWLPALLLVTAAIDPSRQAELLTIAGGAFGLAALTDRLLRWPRGVALPAIVGLLFYAVDLANHSHLVIRSLLGPSPRSGSRFYGLGNELEIALTLLLLFAVAATLPRRERSRGGALAFALGGVVLAAVMGSGRLGADVGGVFTVAGGAAVATLLMLPGGVTRRALGIAILTPLAGLGALALLELATGGNGHFTRNVLHGSGGDLVDTVKRRYEVAWSIVSHNYAPVLTILCLLAVAYALRYRHRVYAALDGDAVWRACLGGGVGASIAGTLFNDSGVTMLFIGVVALTCVTAYLRGAPGPPGERAGR